MTFDPLNPQHRFRRFVENVYKGRSVVSMKPRDIMACRWCGLFYEKPKHATHEALCFKNPQRVVVNSFKIGAKVYAKKLPISPLERPTLRIAVLVWIDGKSYPVLLDEILEIYLKIRKEHPSWLVRQGTFPRKNENDDTESVVQFRVPPMLLLDKREENFINLLNSLIVRARKMGAFI